MRRSSLATTLAAAVLAVGAAASPAAAGTQTLSLSAGYSDRYGDLAVEGRTTWSVQVSQDGRGAWRAFVQQQLLRIDGATGAYRTTTRRTAGGRALLLPSGGVTVSPNEHVITVRDVVVPVETVVQTSSELGSTTTVTAGSTRLSGAFRLAGGRISDVGASRTFTPAGGCSAADHFEDTTRGAAADLHVLGTDLTVEPGGQDLQGTAEAVVSSYRLRGTANC